MKVRNEKPFYYAASIWRENRKVLRQGTINADDVAEAIDRVYDLAKKVWKRSCVDVTILDLKSGEILGTSSIGEKVGQNLLPHIPEATVAEDETLRQRVHRAAEEKRIEDEALAKGFTAWNEPIIPEAWRSGETTFIAADIGTYFTPKRFYKIQGM